MWSKVLRIRLRSRMWAKQVFEMYEMWSEKERFESNITPRFLAEATGLMEVVEGIDREGLSILASWGTISHAPWPEEIICILIEKRKTWFPPLCGSIIGQLDKKWPPLWNPIDIRHQSAPNRYQPCKFSFAWWPSTADSLDPYFYYFTFKPILNMTGLL